MKTNHEILRKIRDSRVVLGVGMLAAAAAMLVGCGDSESEQSTVPLSMLDVSTLSAEDAKQYIEVSEAVESFKEAQSDPDRRLINGMNDLYSRYYDPLQDITFGSGWKQNLNTWVGITAGDQEQVTEVNSRDAIEEIIRDRAIEIATTEQKPEDAADIVDRYIDDNGNVTKQDVLAQLADIVAKKELIN
jgi:hypothetical protein